MDEAEADDPSIIGDEAHIAAKEANGPRGDSPLAPEERDKFDNLILLCKVHHKLIDDQPNTYTVELLHQTRDEHIRWVEATLEFDPIGQRDDEIYATYVDKWSEIVGLSEWKNWSSFVFGGGQPHIRTQVIEQLRTCVNYLLSRIWPRRHPVLESALLNFRLVLQDFLKVFDLHSVDRHDDEWRYTEKFYQIREHDEKRYHELGRKYDYHVDLVQDLMLELTRAANYVCDQVRATIGPSYRLSEGALLVVSGPHMDFCFHTMRVEYRNDERTERPYPGLRVFMTTRSSRDRHFGAGVSEDYFPEDRVE